MADYRKLLVWKRAHALSVFVYRETMVLDADRGAAHYQLQIRRAAASIAANVAEGSAQVSGAQFARYLSMAIGSAAEALNHIAELRSLGLLGDVQSQHIDNELRHIRRMLLALRGHLRTKRASN